MQFQRISCSVAFAVLSIVGGGCGGSISGDSVEEGLGGEGGGGDGGQSAAGQAGLGGSSPLGGSAGGAGSGGASFSGGNGGAAGSGGIGGVSSSAGGTGGTTAPGGAGGMVVIDDGPPVGYVRGAVGVGYGGIRILSRDGGKTWSKTGEVRERGGDDGDLLRSVAFGNKLWVAGGWDKWWTSPDGADWTLRPHKLGIIQGLAYGNKRFIASTIDGNILRSIDGLSWTPLGNAGTGKHSRVVFGDGLFAVSGDPGQTVTSPDGTKWQKSPVADPVAFCGGAFKTNSACYGDKYNAGFWVEGTWLRDTGGIQLSTDGKTWKTVFNPNTNGIDDLFIGWVPGT